MSLQSRILEINTRPVPPKAATPGMILVTCRRCHSPVEIRPDYPPEIWGWPLCGACLPPWFQELPHGHS
jgi:hypothetical protein